MDLSIHQDGIQIGSKRVPYIYRYIKLDRIEQMLMGKNVLANPSRFIDPLESLFVNNVADDVFVQCWTREQTSDAMWQIYSRKEGNPGNEDIPGVRIRTTNEKILKSIKDINRTDFKCKIGNVKYLKFQDLQDKWSAITNQDTEQQVHALMFKHSAFKFEREVRIICWPCQANKDNTLYEYEFKFNEVISQIMIDPFASKCGFKDIRKKLREWGFTREIVSSIRFRENALSQIKKKRV